jgi:hypothetical protein
MVLEVISKEYNGEYEEKLRQYQKLGILYYVVYNSLSGRRGRYKRHESLEVYKLSDGKYELLPSVALLSESGKVVWMPEIGLGIGCERRICGNWEREWLYWYDRDNVRYPSAEERAEQERMIAKQERIARQEAEAIASQANLEKQEAEVIAIQANLDKQQAEAIADRERQQKEKLAAYLKSMGINPDEI